MSKEQAVASSVTTTRAGLNSFSLSFIFKLFAISAAKIQNNWLIISHDGEKYSLKSKKSGEPKSATLMRTFKLYKLLHNLYSAN
jgi:hypothetical protein